MMDNVQSTIHDYYPSAVPTFLSLMFNMSVSLLDLLPFIMDIRLHSLVVLMSFASCQHIYTV
jgi:hypothetical protein